MRSLDASQLAAKIAHGDRAALARGLSLLERRGEAGRALASVVWPDADRGYVVGITGAPGAGKSSLTDRLVGHVRATGDDVAVLAVDPSSPFSGGAILGDSVRMSTHFLDPGVFIRSLASRGSSGGLSLVVPEAIRLVRAAGFPWIIVETVGVGQIEVDIASSADTTVVVTNPGWGDAVQASKAGLLEVGDILVVNKADRPGAADTEADLLGMLALRPRTPGTWIPPVVATSAIDGSGVGELLAAIVAHRSWQSEGGRLSDRRRRRVEAELRRVLHDEITREVEQLLRRPALEAAVDDVLAGRVSVAAAAGRFLDGR